MGSNYSIPEHYKLHFSPEELDKIKETYKILAKRYDGKVLSNGVFVAHFDQQIKDEFFTTRLFHAFNIKLTGFIDIEEFSHGVNVCLRGRGAPSLEFLFSFFAIDSAGQQTIALEEIRQVFLKSAFCSQVAASVSAEELKNQPVEAVALHNFTGKTDQELSLMKGEKLRILKKLGSAWWWCESRETNKRGYAPQTYVKELDPHLKPIERIVASAAAYDKDKDGRLLKADFMVWASKCAETKAILAQLGALKIEPPDPFFLSAPRGFKHLGHLGINPETGQVERRNVPSEWRQLFREAGITDDEWDDADTAQMLVDVVAVQAPESLASQTSPRSNISIEKVNLATLPAPPVGWTATPTTVANALRDDDSRFSLSGMPPMMVGGSAAPSNLKLSRKRRGRSRSESNKPDFERIQALTGKSPVAALVDPQVPPNSVPQSQSQSQPGSPREIGDTSPTAPKTAKRAPPPPPVAKKTAKRAPPPPPQKQQQQQQSPPTETPTQEETPSTVLDAPLPPPLQIEPTIVIPSISIPISDDNVQPGPNSNEDDDIPPPPPPEDDDDIPPPPPEEDESSSDGTQLPTVSFTPPSEDGTASTLQVHAREVDLSRVSAERRASVVQALRKSIYEKRTRSRGPSAAPEFGAADESISSTSNPTVNLSE